MASTSFYRSKWNHHCHLFLILLLLNNFLFQHRTISASSTPTTSLFSASLPSRCPSPPCICHVDSHQRKHVTCASTTLTHIPIGKMDPETQILNITAPPGTTNSISLGRIFHNLNQLLEIHITRSRLPAIGRSTFCPVTSCSVTSCNATVRMLNLSQNSLSMLREDDFNCLSFLETLDLSDNQLQEPPSAVFRQLAALERLSLARNRMTTLVPLMFYGLVELRELDLSGNPLVSIGRDVLGNVQSVERLLLYGCQLTKIESGVFDALPSLSYLDLSNNRLKSIDPTTFTSLTELRVLLLHGNSLTVLPDSLFTGLNLDFLDLSENLLNPLTTCTFCGAKIKHLDLSANKLTSFNPTLLEPIAITLERLFLDRNRALISPPSSLAALLNPLRRLRVLSIVDLRLNETLPESVFDGLRYLTLLNMSQNAFHELSGRLVSSLTSLDTLDISYNQLTFLDPSALQMITRLKYLNRIYFQGNPFSCFRCHILPFIDWLNSDPAPYWNVCGKWGADERKLEGCGQCAGPEGLEGRYLHEPDLHRELEWCTNPEVQLRLQASEPQVGLILAFLIILALIAIILVVVAIYRKHGAVYYTQEDKYTSSEKIYTGNNPTNIGWTHTSATDRVVSLTSTQYSLSRQNTMFSPQSSLDQGAPGAGTAAANGHSHTPNMSGVCDTCANSTAVKQVIASIPAMTEMLEHSLHHSNGTASSAKPNGIAKAHLPTKAKPVASPLPPPPTSAVSNGTKPSPTAETEATQTEEQPVESIGIQTSVEIVDDGVMGVVVQSPKPARRSVVGSRPESPVPAEEATSAEIVDPADVHIYI